MRRIYETRAYGPDPVAGNHWATTVAPSAPWPEPAGSLTCDFAIIGGGFTGLSAALALAGAGADVALFEAEAPGWGASGRNGGFCCLGGARLGRARMERRYGADAARAYFHAERRAVEHVAETLDRLNEPADRHSAGETILAHRASAVRDLHGIAAEIRAIHGVDSQLIAGADLAAAGFGSPEVHGALTVPIGFALNPMKYVRALAAAAREAGARVLANAPVQGAVQDGGGWRLSLPRGEVRARRLLVATNGYGAEDVPRWIRGRVLPVQSGILVTRVLSEAERLAQGWTSRQMCYDTRTLLHYFRLLPDNRMLFGMRGGVSASARSHRAMARRIRADFERFFPAWRGVETESHWSGLVAMAPRGVPFVGPIDGDGTAFAALCFHGNGVAMGSYAGGLLADLALGRPPRHPIPAPMRGPMGRFPLGRFRRLLLRPAYAWYGLRTAI